MLTRDDLVYVAGWLEGEGCFTTITSPAISYASTDLDVLERVHRILGTRTPIRARKRGRREWRQMYAGCLYGRRAAAWMMTLYPLMGERRRERIGQVLSAWRERGRSGLDPRAVERATALWRGGVSRAGIVAHLKAEGFTNSRNGRPIPWNTVSRVVGRAA